MAGRTARQEGPASGGGIGHRTRAADPESPSWAVLLNYRQSDEPYCVGAMHDFLVHRFGADRIFRDCSSLRPGDDYTKLIMDVIRQVHVLVVVIGPHWLTISDDSGTPRLWNPKDWVRREIGLALRLRKHVLPILLDGAEMPGMQVLPKDIANLSSRTAQSVSHRRLREDFERLADRLIDLAPTLGY